MQDRQQQQQQDIVWKSHYFVRQAQPELEHGDKIILPTTVLTQLLSKAGSEQLPSPLTFELRHPHTNATIHCGVKEFSSSDQAELPLWILSALDLKEGDRVLIQLRLLPKGTWTKLKPLSIDYKEITDYRAALEAHLRGHYNTLTAGQILSCRYGGRTYQFKVVEVKPKDAVSITDTDLEVDIEAAEEQQQQQRTWNPSSEPVFIRLNESQSNVEIPYKSYRYWSVKVPQSTSLKLILNVGAGDTDVVVSSKDKKPTIDRFEWASLSSDNERMIRIDNTPSDTLYVGMHGYKENSIVSWKMEEDDGNMEVDGNINENPENTENKVQCKNCHAWVLERTVLLHEGFCYRNNVSCPWGCGKVFKKGSEELEKHWHCDQCEHTGTTDDKDKHTEYYHTSKTCVCDTFTSNTYEALAKHKCTDCPEKMIICRYCHTLTAQGVVSLDARDRLLGLRSHESYCGSRTITCQKCNKPIPIKDIQVHAKIHEVKRQQQTLPPACCNQNCTRPRAKNRLSLCQFCFGPFWISEDDPKNAKLMQKVARKLHSQLTVGCGNSYCRNKYCATCTKDPKDATTAASMLIPLIKNLPKELVKPDPNPELYFCVDESTTRKKFLAEILCDMTEHKFELGWCVKALESEQEDIDRAQAWLDRNAPRKNLRL